MKDIKQPQALKEPAEDKTVPSLPCCTVTAPVRVNHDAYKVKPWACICGSP